MTLDDINAIMNGTSWDEWSTETLPRSGAKMVSVYSKDVFLRVEISFLPEDIENDDFREPWANKFPNNKATSYRANLYYGSTFLKTYLLVSVDGGRALLPLPDPEALTIKGDQYLVAGLFDSTGSLNRYMDSAGIRFA